MKSNKISCDIEDIMKDNMEVENDFVKDMVYGVITYKNQLDELANKYLEGSKLSTLFKPIPVFQYSCFFVVVVLQVGIRQASAIFNSFFCAGILVQLF